MSPPGRVSPDDAHASGLPPRPDLSEEPGPSGHGTKPRYCPSEVDTPRGASDLETIAAATPLAPPRADDGPPGSGHGAATIAVSGPGAVGLELADSTHFI